MVDFPRVDSALHLSQHGRIAEVAGSWIIGATESNLRPNDLQFVAYQPGVPHFHFSEQSQVWLNECQEQDTSEMVIQAN
jgi:hypothetical protein